MLAIDLRNRRPPADRTAQARITDLAVGIRLRWPDLHPPLMIEWSEYLRLGLQGNTPWIFGPAERDPQRSWAVMSPGTFLWRVAVRPHDEAPRLVERDRARICCPPFTTRLREEVAHRPRPPGRAGPAAAVGDRARVRRTSGRHHPTGSRSSGSGPCRRVPFAVRLAVLAPAVEAAVLDVELGAVRVHREHDPDLAGVHDVGDAGVRCHSRLRASGGSGASSRGSCARRRGGGRRTGPRARPRRCATLSLIFAAHSSRPRWLVPMREPVDDGGVGRLDRGELRAAARRRCGSRDSRRGTRRGGATGRRWRSGSGEARGRRRRPGRRGRRTDRCMAQSRPVAAPASMARPSRSGAALAPLRPRCTRTRLAPTSPTSPRARSVSPVRTHGSPADDRRADQDHLRDAAQRQRGAARAVRGGARAGEGPARRVPPQLRRRRGARRRRDVRDALADRQRDRASGRSRRAPDRTSRTPSRRRVGRSRRGQARAGRGASRSSGASPTSSASARWCSRR